MKYLYFVFLFVCVFNSSSFSKVDVTLFFLKNYDLDFFDGYSKYKNQMDLIVEENSEVIEDTELKKVLKYNSDEEAYFIIDLFLLQSDKKLPIIILQKNFKIQGLVSNGVYYYFNDSAINNLANANMEKTPSAVRLNVSHDGIDEYALAENTSFSFEKLQDAINMFYYYNGTDEIRGEVMQLKFFITYALQFKIVEKEISEYFKFLNRQDSLDDYKKIVFNWEKYSNSAILGDEESLKIIKIADKNLTPIKNEKALNIIRGDYKKAANTNIKSEDEDEDTLEGDKNNSNKKGVDGEKERENQQSKVLDKVEKEKDSGVDSAETNTNIGDKGVDNKEVEVKEEVDKKDS
jgi:hypothetical protein